MPVLKNETFSGQIAGGNARISVVRPDNADLTIAFLHNFLDVTEVVFVDFLPDTFLQVLIADVCRPHILFQEAAIHVEGRCLTLHKPPHQIAVIAGQGKAAVDEYESNARHGRRNNGGGSHYNAAEDGAEHDRDNVVERGFLAKGSDARDADQHKSDKKAYDRAASHLKAIEVPALAKKRVEYMHNGMFSLVKANIGPVFLVAISCHIV